MTEVVMSIVTNEDKVLIVRRVKSEGLLQWQFPGGTVEPGETVEQTALRELEEETGVIGEVIKVLGERIHPYTKKSMSYIACKYVSGGLTISDKDLDKAEWVEISKLNKYFTTPLFEAVLEYLNNIIKSK